MSISTKGGDEGETSLLFGKRVSKTHARVWAYGTVDELNSVLGLCRAHTEDTVQERQLMKIQQTLVSLMAELATDDDKLVRFLERSKDSLGDDDLAYLDKLGEVMEGENVRFTGWLIPGDSVIQAFLDQARTTCRRAERYAVAINEQGGEVRPIVLQYLNRLSDILWLMGRAEV